MTDVICNTSPFQYLHQIDQLRILPALAGQITTPPAVVDEIAVGRSVGVDLPDLSQMAWIVVRRPASQSALPLISAPTLRSIASITVSIVTNHLSGCVEVGRWVVR